MSAGIGQAHSFSVDIYPNSTPSIFGLFTVCGPSAIIRGIPLVVIDTLNRIASWWFHAHILKEGSKIRPSVAYRNPPTAILGIFWPGWVQAPSQHCHPASIFARVAASSSMAMLSTGLSRAFYRKAPAALCESAYQARCSNRFLGSAIASAQPFNRTRQREHATQDYEPTKSFTSSVFEHCHNTNVTYASRMGKCPYCGKMVNQKTAHEHWLKCPMKHKR